MVFYNNLLTTCLLTPLAFWAGDFHLFMSSPQLHTPLYTTVNLFSGEYMWCFCFSQT